MPQSTTQLPPLAPASALAARLGRDASDPQLIAELQAASSRFRSAVRRPITRIENDRIVLDGTGARTLRLPSAPVLDVAAVTVGGIDVEVMASRNGLIRRLDSRLWPDALGAVHVTYTHGFDPVPDDVVDAVLESAEARIAGAHARGLSSLQVGGISQTFDRAMSGGVTQAWSIAVARYRIRRGDRA